jgi:hypothetical protein
MTARERKLCGTVKDTISRNPKRANPSWTAARAASDA